MMEAHLVLNAELDVKESLAVDVKESLAVETGSGFTLSVADLAMQVLFGSSLKKMMPQFDGGGCWIDLPDRLS